MLQQQEDSSSPLLCPSCGRRITSSKIEQDEAIDCLNCGEVFEQTSEYINLLHSTASVVEEMSHWDKVSNSGPQIIPDPVVASMSENSRHVISSAVIRVNNGHSFPNAVVAEIGCGTGQSAWHLRDVATQTVSYFGIDVSPQMLRKANTVLPHDWNRTLILANANNPVLAPLSMDLVFTCGALHHLDVKRCIQWISKCLRPGGLLIVYEPNFSNPLAAIGRKFVEGFHTSTERPLSPRLVRQTCAKFGLDLRFERGVGAFSGPIAYGTFIIGRQLSRPVKLMAGTAALIGDRIVSVVPEVNMILSYYFLEIFQNPMGPSL